MYKRIISVVFISILFLCNIYSSIVIDGNLSEDIWQNAKCITGFKTYDPVSGDFPPESTVVYYSFDDNAIYFAFKCFEKSPVNSLTANMDDAYRDEVLYIYLDTYNDKKKAYVFYIYNTGENRQALYSDAASGEFDYNWNTIIYSATQLTDYGWVCEVKIPFNSLKFQKKNIQDWNVLFFRNYTIKDITTIYPPIKREVKKLSGGMVIKEIKINKRFYNLKFVPYGIGTYEKEYTDSLNYTYDKDGRAGGDIWFNPTNNLTCNITINPDFSQIEADVVQFTTNERYMLYYSETRPFFMEGSTYLSDPLNLLYTRRIQNPLYGVKIVGKELNTDIGFLHSRDNGINNGERGYYNALKLSKDFNDNLSTGLFAGNKEYESGLVNDSVRIQGLYSRISSFNIDYNKGFFNAYIEGAAGFNCRNTDTIKNYSRGYEFYSYLKRYDGKLYNLISVEGSSPGYINDMGYFQRNDIYKIRFDNAYLQNISKKYLQYVQYMLYAQYNSNFKGEMIEMSTTPRILVRSDNIMFALGGTLKRENYLDSIYNYAYITQNFLFRPGQSLYFLILYKYGNGINYSENYLGIKHILYSGITYSPINKLYLNLSGSMNRFYNSQNNHLIWNLWYVNANIIYKFTHKFYSRLTAQLNMETKEGFFSELLTYEFNSMSAIYIGITQDFKKDKNFRFNDYVIFGKISYLFDF
ncbi:carbohydrate binding family 9 domain-containing protein [candidate division WOR-3 bacterium]|nr:carbohydrate binding family 9 domain-containing protein [candidate division WOR-3 bacterium]